ncbi:MAG TPA: alpha/beta hydrolase [Thermoanaerobaculia bacterium]
MSVTDWMDSVGLIGPAASVAEVRKALEAAGGHFDWREGDEAWTARTVLWVVDTVEGVPDDERKQFRKERMAGPLVVWIEGIDREEPFVADLIALDVEQLLEEIEKQEVILRGSARRALEEPGSEWMREIFELVQRLVRRPMRGPGSFAVDVTRGPDLRDRDLEAYPASMERGETQDAWIVPVLYGTDRKATGDSAPAKFFAAGRGPLSFGVVEVSLPKRRAKGEIPKPKSWKFWDRENAAHHVLLLSVDPLERDAFTATLRAAVGDAEVPEALLFLHGYNVTFAQAAERAAQVAVDLEFAGVPLVYSWPSQGKIHRYAVDENNVEWSIPHFKEFLRLVLAESGARTVHVIAHSMGNRALVRALETLEIEAGWAGLRQIVFAAPDVDRDTFVELARRFHGRAERFTLYGSSNDLALKASKLVHGYPRAGDSGRDMALVETVDSIDASVVKTDILGHSAFGTDRSILGDISLLLRHGFAPGERFGLEERKRESLRYWVYQR